MIDGYLLKNLYNELLREHARLMGEIGKLDDKKEIKTMQKEIDLIYKFINDSHKLLAFYKEQQDK